MGSLLKDGWDCKFRARKDTWGTFFPAL
jgi:hypothetical protein